MIPMAYHRFIIFACVLAFAVILLGAYTRLADAGLDGLVLFRQEQ